MYEAYAQKLLDYFEVKPGSHGIELLNELVMAVPFAEVHMVHKELTAEKLPTLGESLSVEAHFKRCFFGMVNSDADVLLMTSPFLIKRDYLEALEHWREWRTVSMFMSGHHLSPSIAFRNRPVGQREDYYIGDLRVFCHQETPIKWLGKP